MGSQRPRIPQGVEVREWQPGYRFSIGHDRYEVWALAPRHPHDGVSVWAVPLNPRPWHAPVYLYKAGGRHGRPPVLLPYNTDGTAREVAS